MTCTGGPTEPTGPRNVSEVNRAFEVLADEGRRAVIDGISDDGTASIDDLASRLASHRRSEASARIALHHCHLPMLRDAGVVTYDPGSDMVSFDDAEDVLSVLRVVTERIE